LLQFHLADAVRFILIPAVRRDIALLERVPAKKGGQVKRYSTSQSMQAANLCWLC
jgi:hypothetical protein